MADFAVVAVEHDGDPRLAVALIAQAVPAEVNPLGLELQSQGVDQVVGQRGDEEVGGVLAAGLANEPARPESGAAITPQSATED